MLSHIIHDCNILLVFKIKKPKLLTVMLRKIKKKKKGEKPREVFIGGNC